MSTSKEGSIFAIVSAGKIFAFLFLFGVTRFLYQIISNRFFHPLSKFPGPFWGSVTRLWIAKHCLTGDERLVERDLHKKHGPILRITPTMLLVSDATKLPEIYHRYADKPGHYITGSFGETESVFNMRDWKQHAHFRKLIAGSYSFSNIKRMEPLLDARISEWTEKLTQKFAQSGDRFDFAPWAVFMAYDIISEIAFGEPFGFVETGTDVAGLIQGFHDGLPIFGLMARLHPFTSWVKTTFLGKYLVATPKDKSGIGTVMRFRDKLLVQRLEDMKRGTTGNKIDLMQTILDARTGDGKPLEIEHVKAELLIILLAGADTTGTAFGALLTYVMLDDSVYYKLLTEIDEASRAGQLSPVAQYDEVLEHCPYYVACVKETMRLCPSAPTIFPRKVSKGGIVLDGKLVPEGMELTCNPWLVHRDENVFGKDADEFHPERWLDEERAKLFNKYNTTFGYGARACLGKDLALMELYKGPFQFFRSFRPVLENEKNPGTFLVKGGIGFWKDMWMRIDRRVPAI